MIQDLKRLIEQVSRDKGIEREVLIATLEEAMRSAARKKFGHDLDLEVAYNDEFGEIEAFQFKEVVAKVKDPVLEISLGEGRRYKIRHRCLWPHCCPIRQASYHPENERR